MPTAEPEGRICEPYCLFHVLDDISESHDLAKDPKYKTLIDQMIVTLDNAAKAAPPPSYLYPDFKVSQAQICRNQTATGFLEPLDWVH